MALPIWQLKQGSNPQVCDRPIFVLPYQFHGRLVGMSGSRLRLCTKVSGLQIWKCILMVVMWQQSISFKKHTSEKCKWGFNYLLGTHVFSKFKSHHPWGLHVAPMSGCHAFQKKGWVGILGILGYYLPCKFYFCFMALPAMRRLVSLPASGPQSRTTDST